MADARFELSEQPAHRVCFREVLAWYNGLNGKFPHMQEVSALMDALTKVVEEDRASRARVLERSKD